MTKPFKPSLMRAVGLSLLAALSLAAVVTPAQATVYQTRVYRPGMAAKAADTVTPSSGSTVVEAPAPVIPATPVPDVSPSGVFALPADGSSYGLKINTTTAVPFTVSAWVQVTNANTNGYLLSLSPYVNGSGPLYHSGIILNKGVLSYGNVYYFNSFGWGQTFAIQTLTPGTWTHITAQVDAAYVLKVAVNGHFVYSKQLSSSLNTTGMPEAGGTMSVGIGDPNGKLMPTAPTGTLQQLQMWKSLVYKSTDFTPPARQ